HLWITRRARGVATAAPLSHDHSGDLETSATAASASPSSQRTAHDTRDERQWRHREFYFEAFQDCLAHALHFDNSVKVIVAELRQVLAVIGAMQIALQKLAVKVEPGSGNEPGHGRAARVVGEQSGLGACHHQCC
ncbi:hypothetical protein O3G_MSEX004418, partial [Manduca sexta]